MTHIGKIGVIVALATVPVLRAEEQFQRPQAVPMPPRMVLEPHHTTPQPPWDQSLATSPWAPLVAVTGHRQVLLYHTATLELLGVLPFPDGQPNVVRFSRDGRLLLAGGGRAAATGKVILWDITSGDRLGEVGNELDVVLAADISPDHRRVAVGGPQRLVRVYSAETGQLLYEIARHTDWITAVEFSPDGALLATADRSGGLRLWEADTGEERFALTGHTAAITGVSWRGDSKLLASSSEDATIRLWEPAKGDQVKSWNTNAPVLSLEFTRNGRLVTSGHDQITRVWEEGKQVTETPPIGDSEISATFCDETSRLIVARRAGPVQVYKSNDVAALGTLATNPPALSDRLSAAQQRLDERKTASAPVRDAVEKAEAAVAAVQKQLTAAQQELATHTAGSEELAAENKQLSETRAAQQAEREKLAASRSQLAAAQPLVAEALRHLTEATGKQADDAKLAELHRQLTEQLASMEKRSADAQAKIAELDKLIADADAKLKELKAQMDVADQQRVAATERVASIQAESAKLAAALEAARQASQPAEAELAAAQREVEHWQDEIAFRDQMLALEGEFHAARQLTAERQTALEKANEQLSAAQSVANAAKSQFEEASHNLDAVRAKIQQARKPKQVP